MNPNDSAAVPPSSPAILEKDLSRVIVAAFYEAYNELGFGFLESIYSRALDIALRNRGLLVEREHEVRVFFQGQQIGLHRLDFLVERRVILELKATEKLSDAPRRQLRNYLAAAGLELGILLHFGPKPEFHRILGPRRPVQPATDSDQFGSFG